jgi:hypothetical protein
MADFIIIDFIIIDPQTMAFEAVRNDGGELRRRAGDNG